MVIYKVLLFTAIAENSNICLSAHFISKVFILKFLRQEHAGEFFEDGFDSAE